MARAVVIMGKVKPWARLSQKVMLGTWKPEESWGFIV